jgi:hypothetical protein
MTFGQQAATGVDDSLSPVGVLTLEH